MSERHNLLWTLCRKLPTDFEPFGERDRETAEPSADCSCGCRHFLPLAGELGFDWGVCANPASPRSGLLTFEHQGCPQFEAEDDLAETPVEVAAPPLSTANKFLEEPDAARRTVKVDLEEFIMGMEGFPSGEVRYVLDLASGAVMPLFEEDDDYEARCEEIDSEPERYQHIEQLDSHESFRIMENFAASLPESKMKDALFDALSRNKPFRRYKDVVQRDLTLRDRWFAFREDALARLAADILGVRGIDVEWIRRGAAK